MLNNCQTTYKPILVTIILVLLASCQEQQPTETENSKTQQTASTEIPVGEMLYQDNCAACHSNPDIRAPGLSALNSMSAEMISSAMSSGKMVTQASHLSAKDQELLADHLSKRGDGEKLDWHLEMMCNEDERTIDDETLFVADWGLDKSNTRYQSSEKAGLSASDLDTMELIWAQAFPGVTEMRSQPVVTSNTLYVGASHSNRVYAFELSSGCVKWVYTGSAAIRSALAYGQLPETKKALILYGDIAGYVHAIDASTGEKAWVANLNLSAPNQQLESSGQTNKTQQGAIVITGSPVQYKDRVYIPGSSFEVSKAGDPDYECCTKHGIVRAVDANTGKEVWTYHTTPAATPQGTSSVGTQLWGPSGAPVWTTPAIDEKRNVLYIGTGENYSHPTTNTSDAIIALDLDTGAEQWVFQATSNDAYNMACSSWLGRPDGPNCPENPGPDFDFGASVIITKTSLGKDILLAGQKSGDVWALDPDEEGRVIWNQSISDGTPVGGIHWGMTVVGNQVFAPIADPEWSIAQWDYSPLAGIAALDIDSGEVNWRYESNRGCFINLAEIDMSTGSPNVAWPTCPPLYGNSGAALGLDDMILAGKLNGQLQAFSPENGRLIWEYDTKRAYSTLNGIEGHGGSLDNAGSIAVANGYLIIQSGYSYFDQMPGNVVLVFKKAD